MLGEVIVTDTIPLRRSSEKPHVCSFAPLVAAALQQLV